MGSSVDERISEFEEALNRYKHLYVVELHVEDAVNVERAQLEIIESLKGEAVEGVREGISLEEFTSKLVEEGVAEAHYYSMLRSLVDSGEPSFEEAVRQVEEGAHDKPGAVALLLTLQAIARAYAESYEELRGKEEGGAGCPLCGVKSDVMYRGRDGSYYMLCPFCFYTWKTLGGRLACPYCGSRDEAGLGVYSDRSMRVGLLHCQDCGGTTKVILDSTISAPRPILPLIALGAERFRALLPGTRE